MNWSVLGSQLWGPIVSLRAEGFRIGHRFMVGIALFLVTFSSWVFGASYQVSSLSPNMIPIPDSDVWTRAVIVSSSASLTDRRVRHELKAAALKLRAAAQTVFLRVGDERGIELSDISPYVDGILSDRPLQNCGIPVWVELAEATPEEVFRILGSGVAGVVTSRSAWAAELRRQLGRNPSASPADATCGSGSPLPSLVRAEDLALAVLLPRDNSCERVVLPSTWFGKAVVSRPGGSREIAVMREDERAVVRLDSSDRWRLLVGLRPGGAEWGVFRGDSMVKATELPTAGEIVARHQLWRAKIARELKTWRCINRTRLRVHIQELGRTVEIGLEGQWFSGEGSSEPEWVWEKVRVNGVDWDPSNVPRLPLLTPSELVAVPLQLGPLDAYSYALEGTLENNGRQAYRLTFRQGRSDMPEVSGTALVDAETFALVELTVDRREKQGEVIGERKKVLYRPLGNPSKRTTAWLPSNIDSFSTISAFGGVTSVEQHTVFEHYVLNPTDQEKRRKAAYASPFRVVRRMPEGFRYLVDDGAGGRRLEEKSAEGQMFLLGGLLTSETLEYPLPLGGIQYQTFHFLGQDQQLRLFFGGVVVNAGWSAPRVLGKSFGLSMEVTGQAISFPADAWLNGEREDERSVDMRRQSGTLRAEWRPTQTLRLALEETAEYRNFDRNSKTAESFVLPQDGFETRTKTSLDWRRGPMGVTGWYERGLRYDWSPWGPEDASAFDPETQDFRRWSIMAGYRRALATFSHADFHLGWMEGRHLDRFSGFDSSNLLGSRLGGVGSGRFLSEATGMMYAGVGTRLSPRLGGSLGVSLTRNRRIPPMEGWYNVTGVTMSGDTVGPWGTILSFELGTTVDEPGASAWRLSIVLLKPID